MNSFLSHEGRYGIVTNHASVLGKDVIARGQNEIKTRTFTLQIDTGFVKLLLFQFHYFTMLNFYLVVTKRMQFRLQAAEIEFIKRIGGQTRLDIDKICRSTIREYLSMKPYFSKSRDCKLQCNKHAIMSHFRFSRHTLEAKTTGKRPKGKSWTR